MGGDNTNWGCGPAGFMVLMIIAFLIMIFIANKVWDDNVNGMIDTNL